MSTHLLRVLTVRSQNPKGFGGCIFTGTSIDERGGVQDAKSYCVIRATNSVLGNTPVHIGEWWRVEGEIKKSDISVNGFKMVELQIDATDAVLILPSGEHIVAFMAENSEFRGIGHCKARRLWETFGNELYNILDRRDATPLTKLLTEDGARQVVTAWAKYGSTRTLQWLQSKGLDLAIGRKVLAYFGDKAAERIEEDPYRLLSFCATWKSVDSLARDLFSITENDPRRLQGAIEEACYRLFSDGHTLAPSSDLQRRLESVLGAPRADFHWRSLISTAELAGLTNGSYLVLDDGIHPIGPFVMEAAVAKAVANRLRFSDPTIPSDEVDALLAIHEDREGITLNEEQRIGVHIASLHAFALITGGAGVGKTTLLKALYPIFDSAGVRIFQMALAGRAAKRMQEATGRPATTIASFLRNAKEDELAFRCVIVIDEASMVDIVSMYRICELLPSHARILMIGDPNQLMPVGPGLLLHELATISEIPKAELKLVKRHGAQIAETALAIRNGAWPQMPNIESSPIAFIPCTSRVNRATEVNPIADAVLRLYLQDPKATQILSSRRHGQDGTRALNALCQATMTGNATPLLVWSDELDSHLYTGFRLGDTLLCTRNMWDWGLQNGSLGTLAEIEEKPKVLKNTEGADIGFALAWADWDDGERRPIIEAMLDDLELGYAITVHKAQGSQWQRVIMPITGNRLLDRTLIYTALTRAQRQVILIGDEQAARTAVENPPRANLRRVSLGSMLAQLFVPEVTA
jgi:exodeoxyribonuclease V alpha subunit